MTLSWVFMDLKLNRLFSHLVINKILNMSKEMDINEAATRVCVSKDPDIRVMALHNKVFINLRIFNAEQRGASLKPVSSAR